MMLITLSQDALFDPTDHEGRILQCHTGQSFALDPIATILLQAGLTACSQEAAMAQAREQVEATDDQLAEGFEMLLRDLGTYGLLRPTSSAPEVSVSSPEPVRSQPLSPASWLEGTSQPQRIPQGTRLDWDVFLTGSFCNAPLPRVSWGARGYALWKTSQLFWRMGVAWCTAHVWHRRSLQELHAHQWAMLCAVLVPLRDSPALQQEERAIRSRLARREVVVCQCLVRLFAPQARCLFRSAALTCYLRALGLPAFLVIGRARFQCAEYGAFHAWVELDGRVVNDREEIQTGYTRLAAVPLDDGTRGGT